MRLALFDIGLLGQRSLPGDQSEASHLLENLGCVRSHSVTPPPPVCLREKMSIVEGGPNKVSTVRGAGGIGASCRVLSMDATLLRGFLRFPEKPFPVARKTKVVGWRASLFLSRSVSPPLCNRASPCPLRTLHPKVACGCGLGAQWTAQQVERL